MKSVPDFKFDGAENILDMLPGLKNGHVVPAEALLIEHSRLLNYLRLVF